MSIALLPLLKSDTSLSDSNSFCDKNEDVVNQVTFLVCNIFWCTYIKQTLQLYSINSKYVYFRLTTKRRITKV